MKQTNLSKTIPHLAEIEGRVIDAYETAWPEHNRFRHGVESQQFYGFAYGWLAQESYSKSKLNEELLTELEALASDLADESQANAVDIWMKHKESLGAVIARAKGRS